MPHIYILSWLLHSLPMTEPIDGNAVVYCEGAFRTSTGKTAHGLVRRTERYRVVAVIDSTCAGGDAGDLLDGKRRDIPVVASLAHAVALGTPLSHFVIGLAPIGGRLRGRDRDSVVEAIGAGLHIDSGLHDFLTDDVELVSLAALRGARIRDVRKTPPRSELHAFSGKIAEVGSFRVALLGTDCAIGKRTTAWKLVEGLREKGHSAEMIGTGQTAWLQGARYSIRLDSLINDFVAGELEHAVWCCWTDRRPEFQVIEGQGGLMSPAFPGGLEIAAAVRPQAIVLQHAPARKEYDGFPGFPMHPLKMQIEALQLISGRPVVAVTVNHENIELRDVPAAIDALRKEVDVPVTDVLLDGPDELTRVIVDKARAAR